MKNIQLICLLMCAFSASAVYVNHQGTGDVLLVPYYTVNNDLNTLVSVTNPTENSKAIKINVREGLNGHAVLSYNVYLNAFDAWTFVFVSSSSTISGYAGQESALLFSADESCAPFLQKSGQEFLPFELLDGPQDMSRVREGYIEIIEMGDLEGEFVTYADHGNTGIPANCGEFQAAWSNGGVWDAESGGDPGQDIAPGSGGLMVEADLINVGEGINYSIPVTALSGFFAVDTQAHTSVGDTSLSLDAAQPKSFIMANNKTYELAFESGVDAVSSVLMADEMVATYALDSIVNGQNEIIYTQPTRRFYVVPRLINSQPPFNLLGNVTNCPNAFYGGTKVNFSIFDRESQIEVITELNVGAPAPRPPDKAICGSVFVHSMSLPDRSDNAPQITQSKNYVEYTTPANAVTEGGQSVLGFLDTRPLLGTDVNSNQVVQIMGLPVLGVSLQKFTNAGAAEGLLAQYGGAQKVKTKTRVIE